jgi:2-dehydro-3-deoxyphosphogluconate aldolase/(4S)-4-hydroxy-2-oxoglutarate aldolase
MSNVDRVLQRIGKNKVIAILRGVPSQHALDVIKALRDGGVEAIEVTMNSPDALSIIEQGQNIEGVIVGAGTVLDKPMATAVIERGGQFVLAPNLDVQVIQTCLAKDILPVPGIFTPTELHRASQAGAPLVKVFPVSSVGPAYIKDLLGPFDGLKLLPVGGVSLENARDFMKNGAYAIGVGSYLANPALAERGDWQTITERAKAFVGAVNY